MENNKKGFGSLYLVLGVATLVVAIVGATFAFFSASATNNNVITGNTAEAAGISLEVVPVTKTGGDMIPLNLNLEDTEGKDTVDQFAPAMTRACKDINDNNVCQVYKITVTNNSKTSTIDVRGSLSLTEAAANMKWQLLNVTSEGTGETNEGFAAAEISGHEMDAVSVTTATAEGQLVRAGQTSVTGDGNAARRTLAPEEPSVYYVLFWLEEMGQDQKDDASKTFAGTVTFNAVDASGNESGITASFAQS